MVTDEISHYGRRDNGRLSYHTWPVAIESARGHTEGAGEPRPLILLATGASVPYGVGEDADRVAVPVAATVPVAAVVPVGWLVAVD